MKWKRYVLVFGIILLIGILEIKQAFQSYEGGFFELPSYGNFLVKWLQGMPLITGTNGRQLKIPAEWIVLQGGYLLNIVGDCTQSLSKNNYYELLHRGKRVRWWSAKCGWLVKNTMLYYCGFFLMVFGFSMITGNVGWKPSSEIWLGGLNYEMNGETFAMTFLLPLLASMCVGMMEMLFEIVFSPVTALVLCSGYLVAGIFSNSALFVGNYTMFYRNAMYIGERGVDTGMGMLTCAGGILIFYLLGREKIKRWEG